MTQHFFLINSSNSREPSEAEAQVVRQAVVNRDVAKWVEPVGAGRLRRVSDDVGQVRNIAVIGTGDFGRALASKMVQAGYKVTIGSRNPNKNRLVFKKF